MQQAIEALIQRPARNLRLFMDGRRVPNEDIMESMCEWMQLPKPAASQAASEVIAEAIQMTGEQLRQDVASAVRIRHAPLASVTPILINLGERSGGGGGGMFACGQQQVHHTKGSICAIIKIISDNHMSYKAPRVMYGAVLILEVACACCFNCLFASRHSRSLYASELMLQPVANPTAPAGEWDIPFGPRDVAVRWP